MRGCYDVLPSDPAKIGVGETSFYYAIPCLDPAWADDLGMKNPLDRYLKI